MALDDRQRASEEDGFTGTPNHGRTIVAVRDSDMTQSNQDERNRFDYEQTVQLFQQLTDIRFKLLALVPSAAGLGVAFVGNKAIDQARQFGLGMVGFVATVGIVIYELRNTHFYNECIGRAQFLEEQLMFTRASGDARRGWFNSRTPNDKRLLGLIGLKHDLGLALVYSSSLGAWTFIAADAWLPPAIAGLIATAVGAVFLVDFERHDGAFDPFVIRWGIDRPPDEVFSYLSTPVEASSPRWETVLQLTGLPERALKNGPRVRTERTDKKGSSHSGYLQCVGVDDEKLEATWKQKDDGRALVIRFVVKPVGAGSVLVLTIDFDRPALLRVMRRKKLDLSKADAKKYARDLAARVEARAITASV